MRCYLFLITMLFVVQANVQAQLPTYTQRASLTLDSIYAYFGITNSHLLREHFPYDDQYKADYLGGGENANKSNPYSYLWPFSGSLSAQVARYETGKDKKIRQHIDQKVLKGLEAYYDDARKPYAYASYVNTASPSDRFYDDNIWLGIDFTDLYLLTKEKKYLDKAKEIWAFIESGTDDNLGDGIYWCEQRKESKNTCSNAPGSVYALKLYEATKDKHFLERGKSLYQWTKKNLQDENDYVYFDNINLKGRVDKAKYSYNSGQMLQAAALLYKLTKDKAYLEDAQNLAKGTYNYFFMPSEGSAYPILKKSNVWFHAVMLRGFVELYHIDRNVEYVNEFRKNLDFAWSNMREENGLFHTDWSGQKKDKRKGLLDQFAFVEMYARLAAIDPTK